MKLTLSIAAILLPVLFIAGCGSGGVAQNKPKPAPVADNYPLETCVVSGQKLGSMGEPYVIKYQGKTVKLCCSSCLKEFNTDPAKHIAILTEAEKNRAQ